MAGHMHIHSTEAYRHNDTEGLQMEGWVSIDG